MQYDDYDNNDDIIIGSTIDIIEDLTREANSTATIRLRIDALYYRLKQRLKPSLIEPEKHAFIALIKTNNDIFTFTDIYNKKGMRECFISLS